MDLLDEVFEQSIKSDKFSIHEFNSKKMPVGDQIIYDFDRLFFSKIKTKFWIAGGAITSFLSGDKINDYDFFVHDKKNLIKLIYELRNKLKFKHYMITKQAIKGRVVIDNKEYKIDIVKRLFDNPIKTIEKFDFTITCFAVNKDTFFYHKTASFDLLRKRLVVNNMPYPIDSIRRMQKYIERGYRACNGTIMEIVIAVRELNPEDVGLVEFYPVD